MARRRSQMKTEQFPVVEVVWIDAEERGDTGWNDLDEMLEEAERPCPTMTSVGYCVYRGDDHIAILSTIGPGVSSTMEKIPTGFIVSVTVLREPLVTVKNRKTKTTK